MILVQQTNLIQHAPSVNAGSSAGGKNFRRFAKTGLRLAFSSPIRPAQGAVQISRIVNQLRLFHHQHFRSCRKGVGMLLQVLLQCLDKTGQYTGIII